jgi:CHAD domain-containing protein
MQHEDIHQYRLSVKRWKAAARHSAGKIRIPDEVKAYYQKSGEFRDYHISAEILENLPKRFKHIAALFVIALRDESNGNTDMLEAPPILIVPPPVSYTKVRATLKTIQTFQLNIQDAEALHSLRKYCKDLMYICEDHMMRTHLNLDDTLFSRLKKWSAELGEIHDLYTAHTLCKKICKKNNWKQPESFWLLEYLKAMYTLKAVRFAVHYTDKV